jgi:hypothetical protein
MSKAYQSELIVLRTTILMSACKSGSIKISGRAILLSGPQRVTAALLMNVCYASQVVRTYERIIFQYVVEPTATV